MALVHTSTGALAFLEEWHEQPELEFNLHTAKHRAFRSLFYGFWWTLLYRVLLPSVAFITSLETTIEVYRFYSVVSSSRDAEVNRNVAVAVCCIEGPCMLLMGLGSLLGLNGPYVIPVQLASIVFGAMRGAGILTTVLLGLHLAEECRMMKDERLERRPVFVKNRKVIAAMSVLALGPDVLAIILSGLCYYLVHLLKTVAVFMMISTQCCREL